MFPAEATVSISPNQGSEAVDIGVPTLIGNPCPLNYVGNVDCSSHIFKGAPMNIFFKGAPMITALVPTGPLINPNLLIF